MTKKKELPWLVFICLIGFVVFGNSLGGDFVYDDHRQIVRNPLIQDLSLAGKALTSDVWAFKGDGNLTASNYWRPTFTAWQILNFQIFGLNPWGWRLFNILLHIAVCLLIFLLLRRWKLSAFLTFSIVLLFAVHPVHVQSVAWISGSPDLLFALFFLASIWFAENVAERGDEKLSITSDLLFSLAFYVLALGAKEIAMFCFPIYFLIFANRANEKNFKFSVIYRSVLFALAAAVYFFGRWAVLGIVVKSAKDATSLGTVFASLPSVFVFYLKQIVFPVSIAANYPLRATAHFDFWGGVLPLAATVAACFLFYLLAKRSFIGKVGLALFILPLLPTFNISVFHPEQIVQDRYLYLPLLGFLMLIFPYIQNFLEKHSGEKSEIFTLALAVFLSVPLTLQTISSNRIWKNDLSLWSHTVQVDSQSAFSWSQLGFALAEQGNASEAIQAFNNSLDIKPTVNAYLGRARELIRTRNFAQAVGDLQTIIEMNDEKLDAYTLYQSYEALAFALQLRNDLMKAEKYLREGRQRLPVYYASFTEKIAVILYLQGRKTEVLEELENARDRARMELLPSSKVVFLRLGMLYAEMGESMKARDALQEYLRLTASIQDPLTQGDRQQALELLGKLQ